MLWKSLKILKFEKKINFFWIFNASKQPIFKIMIITQENVKKSQYQYSKSNTLTKCWPDI